MPMTANPYRGVTNSMALNPGQEEVTKSKARFRCVIAGRRWGKTFLSIRELAKFCSQPNKIAFYIAPSYRQAKQIVWEQLKSKMIELKWARKINESDLTVYLVNGSKISLRGADNFDSLRGIGLDFAVFDEFALIEEAAWQSVIRPTLSDRNGSAMFISTPMGKANWAYDIYQRGMDPTDNAWESFSYRTIDGGNVPESEIEQARLDLDAVTFRQEYEASFEEYANRVFYAFAREHNVKLWEQPTPRVIYVGMDFNISPMSAVIFSREDNELHAIDEIEMFSSNTDEMCNELKRRYPTSRIWVFPDSAARQRKTSAGGRTDLTILQNAGFTVKCLSRHNPIRDGVNAINSKLCNSMGQRSLFVDPGCRKLIECFEKHSYKEGTAQPNKGDGLDHIGDAARYAVEYMFPVRRELDPEQLEPRRWQHAMAV